MKMKENRRSTHRDSVIFKFISQVKKDRPDQPLNILSLINWTGTNIFMVMYGYMQTDKSTTASSAAFLCHD